MSWNYRIVKRLDSRHGVYYGLHEVYYRDDGKAWGMTSDEATFGSDDPKEVVSGLRMALKDARKHPVFVEPKKWAATPWKKGRTLHEPGKRKSLSQRGKV